MTFIQRWCAGVLLGSLGFLAGCQSAPSTTVESGIAEDKPANELTEDEASTLCEAFFAVVDEQQTATDFCADNAYLRAAAVYTGGERTDAVLREECQEQHDLCVELTGGQPPDPPPERCTMQTARESCTATVGELETCWSAQIEHQVEVFPAPSDCASLTVADVAAYVQRNSDEALLEATQEECAQVQEGCPYGF